MKSRPDIVKEIAVAARLSRQLQAVVARIQRWAPALCPDDPTAQRSRSVPQKLQVLIGVVGGRFGVGTRVMRSQTRQQPVAEARQVCMALAREKLKMPFEQIARCFHRSRHAARHAEDLARDLCQTDARFRGEYEWCQAELDKRLGRRRQIYD